MIWELPDTFQVLDAIEPHIDRIVSLTLVINSPLSEEHHDNMSRLCRFRFNSLRHFFIPFSNRFRILEYHQFLPGLPFDRLTFEIAITFEFSHWLSGVSIWDHVTTLIVHGGRFHRSATIQLLI
jgi:hypothetical protein